MWHDSISWTVFDTGLSCVYCFCSSFVDAKVDCGGEVEGGGAFRGQNVFSALILADSISSFEMKIWDS